MQRLYTLETPTDALIKGTGMRPMTIGTGRLSF